jgi:hypothetical protein
MSYSGELAYEIHVAADRGSEMWEAVIAAGRKGVSLQRYKGLGEMNPNQLWETTLDTNARSLLQVSVKEIDDANTIFDELMGDKVEPRRVFIEEHALSAAWTCNHRHSGAGRSGEPESQPPSANIDPDLRGACRQAGHLAGPVGNPNDGSRPPIKLNSTRCKCILPSRPPTACELCAV